MKPPAARPICNLQFVAPLILVVLAICVTGCRRGSAANSHPDPHSLAGMRLARPTKLLLPGQTPAGSAPLALPERVSYLSEGNSLGGWMVQPKKDDRRPAVLLC